MKREEEEWRELPQNYEGELHQWNCSISFKSCWSFSPSLCMRDGVRSAPAGAAHARGVGADANSYYCHLVAGVVCLVGDICVILPTLK